MRWDLLGLFLNSLFSQDHITSLLSIPRRIDHDVGPMGAGIHDPGHGWSRGFQGQAGTFFCGPRDIDHVSEIRVFDLAGFWIVIFGISTQDE